MKKECAWMKFAWVHVYTESLPIYAVRKKVAWGIGGGGEREALIRKIKE